MSASIRIVVKDNLGITFDPASLPHTYTRDENGNMLTDTCIEGGAIVRVKTYGGWTQYGAQWFNLTESAWINQAQTAV
jgi:hypothetical protein